MLRPQIEIEWNSACHFFIITSIIYMVRHRTAHTHSQHVIGYYRIISLRGLYCVYTRKFVYNFAHWIHYMHLWTQACVKLFTFLDRLLKSLFFVTIDMILKKNIKICMHKKSTTVWCYISSDYRYGFHCECAYI